LVVAAVGAEAECTLAKPSRAGSTLNAGRHAQAHSQGAECGSRANVLLGNQAVNWAESTSTAGSNPEQKAARRRARGRDLFSAMGELITAQVR
jgi:hypothetical protein